MSSIVGFFYNFPQGKGAIEEKISEMTSYHDVVSQECAHFYTNYKNIALGCSPGWDQNVSLYENDDYTICFKGQVTAINKDNSLRKENQPEANLSQILKLFREKKENTANWIEGIFVFAILEKREQFLWIFTDRGGYEFVYYYRDKKSFIFATDIIPILKLMDKPPEEDMSGICNIYTFNTVFNTRTPFKDINLMPHASVCAVSVSKVNINQYWDYPLNLEHHNKDKRELVEESRQLIQNAVRKPIRSYNNLGVMLSASLYSRLLPSIAANERENLKAFTFKFGEGKSREDSLAKSIADHLGIEFCWMNPKTDQPVEAIERCILDTDGQWAFCDLLPCIREIGFQYPGIALINGFLMDTLFKSAWAFFPGKIPISIERALERRYSAVGEFLIDKMFNKDFAREIKSRRATTIQEAVEGLPKDKPTELSLKFYCVNRARRSHNLAFKAFRKYLSVILPGTNYDLMDFAFRLPYYIRSTPDFYLSVICQWFPEVAKIPWDKTGKPLTYGVIPQAPIIADNIFKMKYYIQRITRGNLDLLNSTAGFNWRLRNDNNFRESIREVLFDQRTLSRGFFSAKAMEDVFKEHLSGKDLSSIFKGVISVEMLFRKFIDYDTRVY